MTRKVNESVHVCMYVYVHIIYGVSQGNYLYCLCGESHKSRKNILEVIYVSSKDVGYKDNT